MPAYETPDQKQIRYLYDKLEFVENWYRKNWVRKLNWVVLGSDGFAWTVMSEFGDNQPAAENYFLHNVENAKSCNGPLKNFRLEKRVGVIQIAEEIEMECETWEQES